MDRTNFTMVMMFSNVHNQLRINIQTNWYHQQGGLGAHDEMCNAFFVYYPLVNLSGSVNSGSVQKLLHIFETAQR